MSIFTTIGIIMQLLQEVMALEPQLEKDVKDILAICDKIRERYLAAQKGS